MPACHPRSHHGSHGGETSRGPRGAASRPGDVPGYASRVLQELGRRAGFPEAQIDHLDELIVPLVTTRAPGLSNLMLVVPPPWSCA